MNIINQLKKWKNTSNTSIVKAEFNQVNNIEENMLRDKLIRIEIEIKETNMNIFAAHGVSIRSYLEQPYGIIGQFRRKLHITNSQKSANWHTKYLANLIKERKYTKERIDKLTGKYWSNKVKEFSTYLILGICVAGIFAIGAMTFISLIPLWIAIVIFYYFNSKNIKV